MRVVAGELRGRRIQSPEGLDTRPTTDRVREATFNALASQDRLDGARVADLFAGTGALGIEALSRGAAHCRFVERDRRALQVLRENLSALGLTGRSTVVMADAAVDSASMPAVDLVLADPPYDFEGWTELLVRVPCDFVVAETGRSLRVPAGWETVREKRYGRTFVAFLERAGELP
jgi:16S rRNA (guanine966-N2)-methyltransferase